MIRHDVVDAVVETLRAPRVGAARVIALGLPLGTASLALAVMALASAILSSLAFMASGMSDEPALNAIFGSPFAIAIMQIGVQGLGAFMVFGIGRWLGGTGTLANAVALMAWLEFLMLVLQVLQTMVLIAAPMFATGIGYAGLALFFWILTLFVCELHGFKSTLAVFFGILGSGFVLSVFALLLLAATVGPENFTNV